MNFTTEIPSKEFGVHSKRPVLGFTKGENPPYGRIAPIDTAHVFDVKTFEALRLWWEWEDTRSPLFISGPTGCGKTSTVMQFLARVNAPAVTITCRSRMDKNDLIGNFVIREGGEGENAFAWQDGPASLAWRHGLVLVINEFTMAPPEVWVSANDLLEGDSIVNERTGEVIPKHPNARVIITDNVVPAGEVSAYLARNDQDRSVVDRCWHVRMDYLDAKVEEAMLEKKLSAYFDLDTKEKACVKAAVRMARKSREQTPMGAIPVSSRVLVRFLSILFRMREDAPYSLNMVENALNLALTSGLCESEGSILLQLANFEFASLFKKEGA